MSRMGFYKGDCYSHSLGVDNACRTTAFSNIYSKDAARSKAKTQLCRSVQSKTPCRFGDKCTYAHTETELVKMECAFGDTCRTKDSKTNPCKFAHTWSTIPIPAPLPTLAEESKKDAENARKQVKREYVHNKAYTTPEKFIITIDPIDEDDEISDSEDEIASSDDDVVSVLEMDEDYLQVRSFLDNLDINPNTNTPNNTPTNNTPMPSTATPFQGWNCNSLAPIDVSAGKIGDIKPDNFTAFLETAKMAERIRELEQTCINLEAVVLHQSQTCANLETIVLHQSQTCANLEAVVLRQSQTCTNLNAIIHDQGIYI